MKKLSLALIIGFSLVLIAGGAFAATDTKPLTVNAVVAGSATLTISQAAINFDSANPDTTPSIPNNEGAVNVTAQARTGAAGSVTLTHQAAGPLTSGSDTIGINQVSWTVGLGSDAGFAAGAMSSSTPVSAGSWTGSGSRSGTFSYALANSWTYAVGTYTASSTYTLTAP
jgi:hypothetical protein